MAKERSDKQGTKGIDGTKFREGYYQQHQLGQGRLITNEENKACMVVVLDVVYRRITEAEGHERITEILDAGVPF